ncbi:putative ATP-dependent DNA ligase YkoU [Paraliobacillus sp. PM-2]|uniref:non-homologous end-joining DNA ligase LigD n=1 Tax=Paraliobacillus sp. PM-2 TaxID=1462524 RepID=UPI00061C1395|nr:hypothetical protein [Paraliobacillus sp. PM-2]CQR46423.1 putative ATP-dependent DNA ligase YkoU [Paraliobacillus sp. PM-2]
MTDQQSDILLQFVKENGKKEKDIVLLPPAICVDIHCLGVLDDALREPMFSQFRFDIKPEACTYEKSQLDIVMIPHTVDLTNRHKRLWSKPRLEKVDLLRYIRLIAPYMLPFLQHRALTIIRCPDGVDAEAFFQKNAPDYAPSFITGNGTIIHCHSVEGLIWLANHGTIEYHIPFQYIDQKLPNEIVFDLDPPSIDAFSTSVYAAQLLKALFDQLGLISFVKTSGSKGLQVHIPITVGSLSAFIHLSCYRAKILIDVSE